MSLETGIIVVTASRTKGFVIYALRVVPSREVAVVLQDCVCRLEQDVLSVLDDHHLAFLNASTSQLILLSGMVRSNIFLVIPCLDIFGIKRPSPSPRI